MRRKINSYLGFAKRSGNLVAGYNACEMAMKRNKIKLLLVTEDVSDNSKKKFRKLAAERSIPLYIFSITEDIPLYISDEGKGIFGITDHNFAKIIELEMKKEAEENADGSDNK
jgi:ribosomal protein L7Ae-like RNA K-turn-binding protein